jgi:lysozyme family protein
MAYSFADRQDAYRSDWNGMTITRLAPTMVQAKNIFANKDRLVACPIGVVPWFVIGITLCREAGSPLDFNCCIQNGQRIIGTGRKTTLVPAGEGPWDTFEDCVADGLQQDGLSEIPWDDGWGPEHVAYFEENWNGWGYKERGLPSPYDWGGTSVQKPGKYVSDGVFDPNVMDTQIGAMALLSALMQLDATITFTSPTPVAYTPTPLPPSLTAPQQDNWFTQLIADGEAQLNTLIGDAGGLSFKGKAIE